MGLSKLYLTLVAGIVLLYATACNPAHGSNKDLNSKELSPSQVVKDYYEYVAKHDVSSASQFLARDVASEYRTGVDSDFNNVNSVSHVVVTKPYNIRLDNRYKYEVQVDVGYTAEFKRLITVPSGEQDRFVYLGRNSVNQPWLIISIGTGP